jgi:hypothetical protein
MAKAARRFWTGSPDGFGIPDDELEGLPIPDEDGMVYPRTKRGAKKAEPRRAGSGKAKKRTKRQG